MLRAMLRDTITYSLPAMLSQGLGLVLLPIYARVLTRDEFGALDLMLAISPIVTIVMSLEIQQGLARLRADASAEERRRMTGTAWVTSAAGFLVFVAVGLGAADPLGTLLFGREGLADTVRLGVLSVTATAVYNVVLNQFRWELRSRTYAVISSLYAIVAVGLTVLLTVVDRLGLAGVLLSQTIAGVAATIVGLVLLRGSWRLVVDRAHLRRMLAFSLPLIPASLSVFVTLYFNRVALRIFGDLGDVASYGMAARLAGFVGLLIVGMQSAVTPLIYNHYRDKETPGQLAHMFSGVIGLCIAVSVGLNAFAADLTTVFAGRAYLSSAPLVALIAPALLMGQLYVFAPGMGIALKTRAQLGVAVAAAAVDVLANIALVPTLGALGAALATVASSCAFLGLWFQVSQKHYPIPLEYRILARGVGLLASGSVVAVLVRNASQPLEPVGLVVKVALVLGCLALLHRARLFEGVLSVLRVRPTASTESP
ncbi:oligosaccharide flippase family protein [Pedococcus soli]